MTFDPHDDDDLDLLAWGALLLVAALALGRLLQEVAK